MSAWRDTPVFVWTGMVLSDADYSGLARSVRSSLSTRGASLSVAVDALRRWRPSAALLPGADFRIQVP